MLYRKLGNTGVRLSVLGMGAAPLGGGYGAVSQDTASRTVAAAIAAGINYIDVAPYYGETKAESVLGVALRGVPRDKYFLSTKVGRYKVDAFDFSARRVAASVDESLTRLGIGHIDMIICHDIEFGDINQVIRETLPALRKVRDAGKVRYIGVSGLPLAIFPRVLEETDLDFVLSYCHYCLNDTALADLVPYLRKKNVGVINAAPLGMGLLSGRPLQPWHPAPPELRKACERAAVHCAAKGVSLPELALRFALANDAIDTTLVGPTSPEDVARSVQAVGSPPDSTLLREVLAIFEPVHNMTWAAGRAENAMMKKN